MLVLPQQNTIIWTAVLMSRLCINAELLTVAAARWLQLSEQEEMPEDSQGDMCITKL